MQTSQFAPLESLLGPHGPDIVRAMRAATEFLASHSSDELLARVGTVVDEVPRAAHLTKDVFQASYGGRQAGPPDDVLTGRGLFFITEQRKLFLDCTGGHYQMTWGYRHPSLDAAMRDALDMGIVWDAHSNIPGATVKRLSYKLVELCNPDDAAIRACDSSALGADDSRLNTVLLGICTGSVACSTALKIMLMRHERVKGTPPVMVTLNGNYHGTDIFAQRMRGMWEPYFANIEFVNIEPNDTGAAQAVFARYGERVMGFMCEPILMNREAILVEPQFMRTVRRLCDEAGALLAVDEIQTGSWCTGFFHYLKWGITPDFVICGKGMAAGLHPLAAVIYKRPLDLLAQYDSISTNGNAPLAAYVALQSIAMIEEQAERIAAVAAACGRMLREVAAEHPHLVRAVHGDGLLSGLKFHRVADALEFHRRCVERGLWVRAHAYHEGHSTVLCKFALLVSEREIGYMRDVYSQVLSDMAGTPR
jgi:acetylornithine/succinyldiaminopimelate/putrescine aminotransferase